MIYVASSWRSFRQTNVVQSLRAAGLDVYDFQNPNADDVSPEFSWRDVHPHWAEWTTEEFRRGLDHSSAIDGFRRDFEAMKAASACVLVLPCGRSAHLEAGWFVGQGKPLHIAIFDPEEPELMYAMATTINASMGELLTSLGVRMSDGVTSRECV